MTAPGILAQLCADLYDETKITSWANHWELDDVHVGHAVIGDTDVLVLRGSVDATDWIRDCEAVPQWHKDLGFLHSGFAAGMDDVLEETRDALKGKELVITGHSLGGARARILAGLRVINSPGVAQVTVFGSPKPGFINLSRVIQKSGMIHTSWRNRNDVVPLVPGILPWWSHPEPWGCVNVAPAVNAFDPLRDHSIKLYCAGFHASTSSA